MQNIFSVGVNNRYIRRKLEKHPSKWSRRNASGICFMLLFCFLLFCFFKTKTMHTICRSIKRYGNQIRDGLRYVTADRLWIWSLRCDSYPETQGLFWSLKWELNYSLFVFQVSLSDNLYTFMHQLWLNHAPIGELF